MNKGRSSRIKINFHVSYNKNNDNINKSVEELAECAKTLVDRIEEKLSSDDVSNTDLERVLKQINKPKPKVEDKKQKMKLLIVLHINKILDEVNNMAENYSITRRKISYKYSIVKKIDSLSVIGGLLISNIKKINI